MKTYFVFWTYMANYATSPVQVDAGDFVEAAIAASPYDPYKGDKERMRFIIFEEGGTLVWDGQLPKVGDKIG